jgi:hypothetical protein
MNANCPVDAAMHMLQQLLAGLQEKLLHFQEHLSPRCTIWIAANLITHPLADGAGCRVLAEHSTPLKLHQ